MLGIFHQNLSSGFLYNDKWRSQNLADDFSSAINNVSLLDGNASFGKYFFWNGPEESVSLGENSVLVWWNPNQFSSAPIIAQVDWKITDVNGLIVFRKVGGVVRVGYE